MLRQLLAELYTRVLDCSSVVQLGVAAMRAMDACDEVAWCGLYGSCCWLFASWQGCSAALLCSTPTDCVAHMLHTCLVSLRNVCTRPLTCDRRSSTVYIC